MEEFLKICRLLYDRKYVVGSGGNVSIKKGDKIYITPTGSILGLLEKEDIAIINLNGEVIKGNPSSERYLHLEIYKKREDVNAIIHTHSLISTYLSLIDKKIELLTPEGEIFLKNVGYVDYYPPGSYELAKKVAEKTEDCIILKKHGVVCLGKTLKEAYIKVEVLEEQAKLTLLKLLNSF